MGKRLTIMVVPDSTGSVRRYRIPKVAIRLVGGVLLTMLVTFSVGVYLYGLRAAEADASVRLRDENVKLRHEIIAIHEKAVATQTILDRIQRFDTKLRTITQLHDPRLALGPFDIQKTPEVDEGETVIDPVVLSIAEQPQLAVGLLGRRLDELIAEAQRQEGNIRQMETFLRSQHVRLASTPSIWPASGWLTSTFGVRIDPYTGKPAMHRGIDIANEQGVPVIAPAAGIVTFAEFDGAFGRVVVLDHGYGIRTRYAHMAELAVRLGDRVERGARIGSVGNSGRSTGPHLHYEVDVNGIAENPLNFILED